MCFDKNKQDIFLFYYGHEPNKGRNTITVAQASQYTARTYHSYIFLSKEVEGYVKTFKDIPGYHSSLIWISMVNELKKESIFSDANEGVVEAFLFDFIISWYDKLNGHSPSNVDDRGN